MQLVSVREESSHRPYSFANQLKHRPVRLNTSRCYCGKVWAKMWQNDQSHERLGKHSPTNMFMTTKWEAINHLITTLGLIVILHITLYVFIYISAPILMQVGLHRMQFSLCVIYQVVNFSKKCTSFKLKGISVACICLFLMMCSWTGLYGISVWPTEFVNTQKVS